MLQAAAWDGHSGAPGDSVSLSGIGKTGGTSSFSTTTLTAACAVINHAPIWAGSGAVLTPVLPGDTNPSGDVVASVFGSFFHDSDGNVQAGIAVTGLTRPAGGTWSFSSDGGVNWMTIGNPSASAALLLSASDLIRFVPGNSSFRGTATLQAVAWDGSTGTEGNSLNLTGSGKTGGHTAFGTTTLTASCPVNTAPVLTFSTGPVLPFTRDGVASTAVAVTTLLNGAGGTDPDGGTPKGVAIVSAGGPGKWQFTLDGKTWQDLGSVSETSVRLLDTTTSIRFLPAVGQGGQASLTYRAWDQTAGKSGSFFAVHGTGIAYSLSAKEVSATLIIRHAPMWSSSSVFLAPVLPGTANPPGDTVAAIFGNAFLSAVPGTSVGIAVVGQTATPNEGEWQYVRNGVWTKIQASAARALLLSATDRIRFLPKPGFVGTVTLQANAWDGGGIPGGTADLSGSGKTGGRTGFSTTTVTASCTVNTAPALNP